MKVALLSKYSRLGASSRLRSLQYLPSLREAGIQITSHALFSDDYLKRLYSGNGRSLLSMAQYYWRRAKLLRSLPDIDVIWMEKEALPYIPYLLERELMPNGIPYVVDYDDAVFHNYDLSSNRIIRRLLAKKIDRVMANASVTICGNNYLAERARKAGATFIERVPTVVDTTRYPITDMPLFNSSRTLTVGWIGSPSTQHYILKLKPVLEALCREKDIQLVLVGAQSSLVDGFGQLPVRVLPWSENSEVSAVAGFDIGVMPLLDGPWERGKCGYKLLQYMAAGKPVVASPVGVNVEIVERAQCGKLADGQSEWYQALRELLTNFDERLTLGSNGRRAVERYYSLQVQAPRLADIFYKVAGK